MNKTVTSLMALGIGAAAYQFRKGNMKGINGRTMRKMRKRIVKSLF